MKAEHISTEMRRHAPFTFAGTATGVVIMAGFMLGHVPQGVSEALFWTFHPLHVLLSALVTAAMYRLHGGRRFWLTLLVGYAGSVGIATLSDSIIFPLLFAQAEDAARPAEPETSAGSRHHG